MLRSNEPEGRPAPRLFLGYTMGGYVVRFGEAVPDDLVRRLAEVIERQPKPGDLRVTPPALPRVKELLARHAPITAEEGGPAYPFPESITRPSEVIQVTDANVDVLRDTFP